MPVYGNHAPLPLAVTPPTQVAPSVTGPLLLPKVDLDWDDNPGDTDFSHFDVYRSTVSGSGYAKINAAPVLVSAYTDYGVERYQTYFYVVKSVDLLGNASDNSAEFSQYVSTDPTSFLVPTDVVQRILMRR